MEGEKREEWRRERWVPSMKSQPNHWRVSFLSLITRPMARSAPETNLLHNTQLFPSLSTIIIVPTSCTSVAHVNFTLQYFLISAPQELAGTIYDEPCLTKTAISIAPNHAYGISTYAVVIRSLSHHRCCTITARPDFCACVKCARFGRVVCALERAKRRDDV